MNNGHDAKSNQDVTAGKADAMIVGPQSYVTFYTDEEAQKGALRETLVSPLLPADGRLLIQCRRKGRKLGAKSFVVFVPVPRVWQIPDEELSDD